MVSIAGKKYPYWTLHCENCLRCMGYCNHKAVEAGHSWGIMLGYITSVPVVFWISVWLHEHYSWLPKINSYWLNELLTVFYFIPAVLIAYRLFWLLIRFKPINTLFTFSTLTKFYRRYHEPGTKLKRMTLLEKKRSNSNEK